MLAHRIVDILFQEGARFSVSQEDGGRERVERALTEALLDLQMDPETVTIDQFRLLYHQGWQELLDRLCPSDTHTRVTDRFYQLVFA